MDNENFEREGASGSHSERSPDQMDRDGQESDDEETESAESDEDPFALNIAEESEENGPEAPIEEESEENGPEEAIEEESEENGPEAPIEEESEENGPEEAIEEESEENGPEAPIEEESEENGPEEAIEEESEENGPEEAIEEDPFTLRLNESDCSNAEDEIPEVQPEINREDEEEATSGAAPNALLIGLLTSGGATSDENNNLRDPLTWLPVSARLPLSELSADNRLSNTRPNTTSTNNRECKASFISAKKFPPEPLPAPKLFPEPIYTVTRTSPVGIKLTRSNIADTIDPKTSISTISKCNNNSAPILGAKNAFPESISAKTPHTLPANVESVPVVPVSTASVEPERYGSFIDLDSTTNNNNTNNISTSNTREVVRPIPRGPPPPYPGTSSVVIAPPSLAQLILRMPHNDSNSGSGMAAVAAPPSDLKIQSVVSLAPQRHLTEDFLSNCMCSVCSDLRRGDLWRQCQQPRGPNGGPNYKCAVCDWACESRREMVRHCRHNKHGRVCGKCEAGFLNLQLYNLHKMMHEGKQFPFEMAANVCGVGVVVGPAHQQPQGRTDDDEVTVVGEIVHNFAQRTTSTNGSANPAQLDRILNNSEITVTTVTADGSDAGGQVQATSTTGSGTSAGLRNILPTPSSVAPPTHPTPTITTPTSTNQPLMSVLQKAASTPTTHRQRQQVMARPTLTTNAYRMMPIGQSGPPRPAPAWHHSMAWHPLPYDNNHQALGQPPPAFLLSTPPLIHNGPHQLLPAHIQAQQLMAMNSSAQYGPLLTSDPRQRMMGPPIGIVNGPHPPRTSSAQVLRAAPPVVTPVCCHQCQLSFPTVASFQAHFHQTHMRPRAPPPIQYKCKRCSWMGTSIPQMKRHEARCVHKGRSALLFPSQDSPHFALTHSGPGSGAPTVDAHLFLATHHQQPEVTLSLPSLPEIEIIESQPVDFRPYVTATPILPEATPTDVRDFSSGAEVTRLRPEASMVNLIPEMGNLSVSVNSAAQPEVVDISKDFSRPKSSTSRPEVNEPEMSIAISVEPEKNAEVVAEPKVRSGVEEDIPEVEVSRSPQPDVIAVAEAEEVHSAQTLEINLSCIGEAEDHACVVCDRTFADAVSLEQHLRTHALVEPEVAFGSPPLVSCSSQKTSCPAKRTLQSPQPSPAKRPRVDQPEVLFSAANVPPTEARAIEPSPNLAVAILDIDKFGANVQLLRNMGVVGCVSLEELRSFLSGEGSTGSLNFVKKF